MLVLLEREDVEDLQSAKEWMGRVVDIAQGWRFCATAGSLFPTTLEMLVTSASVDAAGNLEATCVRNTYRWSVVMQPIRRKK